MKKSAYIALLILSFVLFGCSSDSPKPVKKFPAMSIEDSISSLIANSTGSFDFGEIYESFDKSEVFTIKNGGDGNLNLTGTPIIEITGADASAFSVIQNPSTKILPPDQTTFEIKFTATAVKSFSATVSIDNNDSNANPFTFAITGVGKKRTPEIDVKHNLSSVQSGTGNIDFGNINVQSSSTDYEFVIENLGLADLVLPSSNGVTISGTDASMFNLDDSMTSSTIQPTKTTKFKISFTPTSSGLKTASISISNNDSDENPYTFTIQGTGKDPEINVKQDINDVSTSTGVYDFGNINVGSSSATVTFTIENLGNTDLILNGSPYISITGSGSAMFVLNQSLTSSPISPQSNTTFALQFSPSSLGLSTATISISNNDSDENPYTFSVTGTGISPSYLWTRTIGGSGREFVYSSTISSSGNIYMTGFFDSTVNFGDDFGLSDNKTPKISSDIYVTKTDTNGNYGWTKQFLNNGTSWGRGITADSAGNVYVTGKFAGETDFGIDFGASDVLTSQSGDVFVTKINSNDTYGWTKKIGGSGDDEGKSIITDSAGNIYVAGKFSNTVNFAASFGGSDSKSANGSYDAFITKINANGTYGWTRVFGGSASDFVMDIVLDSSGNIYLTGWFEDTVNFGKDFSTIDNKTSAGDEDIFIMKLTTSGAYGWTKVFGSTGEDYGVSVEVDSKDSVYFVGRFQNTVNFKADFGGTDNKTSAGSTDVFITKISSSGSYEITKRFGGNSPDYPGEICIDSNDNIYIVGDFQNTADFGSDFSVSDNKTSNGAPDVFITKISSSFSYKWTRHAGGSGMDFGESIFTDSKGDIYFSGMFSSKVDFAKDFGSTDSKSSHGGYDFFITKVAKQ